MIQIEDFDNANIIINGDFNSEPIEENYKYLEQYEFYSAFKFINGIEP